MAMVSEEDATNPALQYKQETSNCVYGLYFGTSKINNSLLAYQLINIFHLHDLLYSHLPSRLIVALVADFSDFAITAR